MDQPLLLQRIERDAQAEIRGGEVPDAIVQESDLVAPTTGVVIGEKEETMHAGQQASIRLGFDEGFGALSVGFRSIRYG